MNETKQHRKYRIATDSSSDNWTLVSWETDASDVFFEDGSNLADKIENIPNISGITDDVTNSSSDVVASAKSVNTLYENGKILLWTYSQSDSLVDALNQFAIPANIPVGETRKARLVLPGYSTWLVEATNLDVGVGTIVGTAQIVANDDSTVTAYQFRRYEGADTVLKKLGDGSGGGDLTAPIFIGVHQFYAGAQATAPGGSTHFKWNYQNIDVKSLLPNHYMDLSADKFTIEEVRRELALTLTYGTQLIPWADAAGGGTYRYKGGKYAQNVYYEPTNTIQYDAETGILNYSNNSTELTYWHSGESPVSPNGRGPIHGIYNAIELFVVTYVVTVRL